MTSRLRRPSGLVRTHRAVRIGIVSCVLAAAAPAAASAQIANVLSGMRQGGGWVAVPIVAGVGRYNTPRMPTGAMSIAGCVMVWGGHSGTWEIRAHESVLGSNLRLDVVPGRGVTFEHDFGMTAQVDIEFRWSEARDTTLNLWVGVDPSLEKPEEVCTPPQSGS